jgi:hypothetical protein
MSNCFHFFLYRKFYYSERFSRRSILEKHPDHPGINNELQKWTYSALNQQKKRNVSEYFTELLFPEIEYDAKKKGLDIHKKVKEIFYDKGQFVILSHLSHTNPDVRSVTLAFGSNQNICTK